MTEPVLDALGWYIATTHQLVGHETAARFIGVPAGDPNDCALCKYERTHDEADRLAVIVALQPTPEWVALTKPVQEVPNGV